MRLEEVALPPEARAAVFDRVEGQRAARVRLFALVAVLALWAALSPVASAATRDRQPNRSDPAELWSEFPLQPSQSEGPSVRRSGSTLRAARPDASGVASDPSSDSFDWALPIMLVAGAGLTATLWLSVVAVRRNGKYVPTVRAPAAGRERGGRTTGGIRYRDY